MLIWICALHCEAKPVIDYYRLKKSHDDSAFDLYRGEDMLCVVSGIGKVASAAATAWSAERCAGEAALAWINLGVAGAAEHDLGSIFTLDKIVDGDTGQRYYPVLLERSTFPRSAAISLSLASSEYRDGYLYDMEASGFVYAALRFSSAELIQSIKVVSDNQSRQTGKNPADISALIHAHIGDIAAQATRLDTLKREVAGLEIDPETWRLLTARIHFSQTQKNRLRGLLRYLLNRDHAADELLQKLTKLNNGKAVIDSLEQICRRDSEQL